MHIIDVPETPDDAGIHADNTYKEEAFDKTCLEKTTMPKNIANGVQDVIVPDVQDMPDVPDVPRTTAHNIFNTKGHQTNSWQLAANTTL